jgi:hypothetical protein
LLVGVLEPILEIYVAGELRIAVASFGNLEILSLRVSLGLEVVKARACVVDVSKLREVLKVVASHLQDWHHDSEVVGGCEILPLVIFKVTHIYSPVQVHIKCPEMRGRKYAEPSVSTSLLDPLWVVNASPHLQVNRLMHAQVIGIQRKQILLLVPGINEPEHLRPNQVIIAVNDRHNLSALAQPSSSIVDVG